MNGPHATRFSLLVRLRDMQDTEAWFEFVEIYTPVVYGFLRKRGLQDADAADVTQDVFRKVSRSIHGFQCDRQLGSFRGWLLTVTRSSLADLHETRSRQPVGSADTAVHRLLEEESADDDSQQTWESEYRQSVFGWAVRQIRKDFEERTWQAFWKAGVEGLAAKDVAEALGMSVGAVYTAKCRVLDQLKQTIQGIEKESES
jgi:RNA polymerase sigma-70 factor (ECF subfamily)